MNNTATAREIATNGDNASRIRPFVKWAGGKSQLLPELLAAMPENYERYFEPFVGGGALFFASRPQRSVLSDSNDELMNLYRVVKNDLDELLESLAQHVHEKDYYYEMRERDRAEGYLQSSSVERASRTIYLNKTCFNGLYRVNSKGHFNVPFGDYAKPKIVDEENLRRCSQALTHCELLTQSFLDIEAQAQEGDFVYFDPPYVPLSDTSHFTSYSKDGFGLEQQRALAELCKRLDKKGVKFMLSNSYSTFVLSAYEQFSLQKVKANRAINSKASGRGKIYELLVTNYASGK